MNLSIIKVFTVDVIFLGERVFNKVEWKMQCCVSGVGGQLSESLR
jgi:hypothetical protein